jgi:hypothetical protein
MMESLNIGSVKPAILAKNLALQKQ